MWLTRQFFAKKILVFLEVELLALQVYYQHFKKNQAGGAKLPKCTHENGPMQRRVAVRKTKNNPQKTKHPRGGGGPSYALVGRATGWRALFGFAVGGAFEAKTPRAWPAPGGIARRFVSQTTAPYVCRVCNGFGAKPKPKAAPKKPGKRPERWVAGGRAKPQIQPRKYHTHRQAASRKSKRIGGWEEGRIFFF